ncbi:MAG: single-stranded DNA-binding protein [Gammaproteobacteria bacterium]|nr:MAG: single-stranded DNA-binding protein [Gammaproteobacteria bacterium]
MSQEQTNNNRAFGSQMFSGVGYCVTDATVNETKTGKSVLHVRVAFPTNHKNINGEQQKLFVDVDRWNTPGLAQYLKKGKEVWISGQLVTETYTNQEGQNRSRVKLIAESIRLIGAPRKAQAEESEAVDAQSEAAPF